MRTMLCIDKKVGGDRGTLHFIFEALSIERCWEKWNHHPFLYMHLRSTWAQTDSSKPRPVDGPCSSSHDTNPNSNHPLATLPMFLQYLADWSVIINKYPINLYYVTAILSFKYFLNLTPYSISIYTLLTMGFFFFNITWQGGKDHYSKNVAFAILVN